MKYYKSESKNIGISFEIWELYNNKMRSIYYMRENKLYADLGFWIDIPNNINIKKCISEKQLNNLKKKYGFSLKGELL